MSLVLGVQVGDVIDVGRNWIELIGKTGPHAVEIQTGDGRQIVITAARKRLIFPNVRLRLGPDPTDDRIRLVFAAPRSIHIGRRRGQWR
jgi:hypothetical protein